MVRTMSAQQARANFGDLLGSVYYTRNPVIVEKKGKPYAVVISPEDFELLKQHHATEDWAMIERLRDRNADKDPDQVLADVTAVVEEVRQEIHQEAQRAAQRGR